MTALRFELTSQLQKVSRLATEPPGRPAIVFPAHSFWTSSSWDVPAGVTQEEGHTGFFIHLLPAVRALIFFARRIQPFLSLVDREVEFCVLTIQSFSTRWAFLVLVFSFFSEKNPVYRDRTQVPTRQKVTRLHTSELPGRPAYGASLFPHSDPLLGIYLFAVHGLSERTTVQTSSIL